MGGFGLFWCEYIDVYTHKYNSLGVYVDVLGSWSGLVSGKPKVFIRMQK